jgi:hypothetical protein
VGAENTDEGKNHFNKIPALVLGKNGFQGWSVTDIDIIALLKLFPGDFTHPFQAFW